MRKVVIKSPINVIEIGQFKDCNTYAFYSDTLEKIYILKAFTHPLVEGQQWQFVSLFGVGQRWSKGHKCPQETIKDVIDDGKYDVIEFTDFSEFIDWAKLRTRQG